MLDRTIRLVITMVVGGICGYFGWWWGVVVNITLITALVGYCPLYSLLGINTAEQVGIDTDDKEYEPKAVESIYPVAA